MLKPAILYKEQIETFMKERFYTEDMMFETGGICNWIPCIEPYTDNCSVQQYAITNNDSELVGFIMFTIDWYSGNAGQFGLISFDKGSRYVSLAVREIMHKLICDYRLHRIEWRMVGGNPAEKHYDYWCKRLGGRKITLRDAFKDKYGDYHNDHIYEILIDD